MSPSHSNSKSLTESVLGFTINASVIVLFIIEKAEMLEFYMVRAIMAMFPQYAWDEHLLS